MLSTYLLNSVPPSATDMSPVREDSEVVECVLPTLDLLSGASVCTSIDRVSDGTLKKQLKVNINNKLHHLNHIDRITTFATQRSLIDLQ